MQKRVKILGGRFNIQLLDLIGKGNFSEVYLAENQKNKRQKFAVKQINRKKLEKMGLGKKIVEKEKNIMYEL